MKQSDVEREPHLLWNAFIDLLAVEEYADLDALQRKAHLVFWYESEVQNGGHGQYFENFGSGRIDETITALRELGLHRHAVGLARAAAALSNSAPDAAWEDRLDDELIAELDDVFHSAAPPIIEALKRHLQLHRDKYIQLT